MNGCPTLAAFLFLRLGWEKKSLLGLRPSRLDRLRSVELLEVRLEARRQLRRRLVVSRLVGPRVARIQYLRRNIRATHRNAQPEGRLGLKLHLAQSAVERRIHQRPRNLQTHALANAELPAGPTSIDQPARSLLLREPLSEHLRINARGERQEGRGEASRKTRRRVLDARLSPR